jgi:translation initiation factor IF-1
LITELDNLANKDKDDMIITKGRVTDASPGARFKVKLENGHVLNAVVSGKIRKNNIQILLDDVVEVEMSPYDLNLGRITYRF